jgi:cell shape-determining protein MreC
MVSDELGRQLHNRETLGESLTYQEQAQLEAWYAEQDRAEVAILSASQDSLSDPKNLQDQVNEAIEQLALSTQQLQRITSENQSLREEIARLKQQVATQQSA